MTPTPIPTGICDVITRANSAFCSTQEFADVANDQLLMIVPLAIGVLTGLVFVFFTIARVRQIIRM